jgi:predicted HicB family RNase H-like nuclease
MTDATASKKKRDGRSLRATGRTHPFATRIKPETHEKMLDIAERDEITLGELIEKAIDAYERDRPR